MTIDSTWLEVRALLSVTFKEKVLVPTEVGVPLSVPVAGFTLGVAVACARTALSTSVNKDNIVKHTPAERDSFSAKDLANAVMRWEKVPPLALFNVTAIARDWDDAQEKFFADDAIIDTVYRPKPR